MFHYTYRITNLKENKHYYGVRTSKIDPGDDLGIKYFSSSTDKVFIQDQKENSQNYKYKIIKIFKTRKHANDFEIKLHRKFLVSQNQSFYNLAMSTSSGFTRFGIPSWNSGKKGIYSKETIEKISQASSGRFFSEETKKLLSAQRIGNKFKKGIKESNESRELKSKIATENNTHAKNINIYDNNDNLIFECFSNFRKICEENGLPYKTLWLSYKNNQKVFDSINGYSKDFINKYKQFTGWYARIV